MSPVHLRNLGFKRNQPENREGLSRTRTPGRGHLGQSGRWQETQGYHTHSAIHFPIQQEPQIRGLERYGYTSSAPPATQRFISIDFRDLMVINKRWNPTRKFRLLEVRANIIRETQATIQDIEEQLTQTGNAKITSGSQVAGKISSPVASHHSETNRSVAKSHHS
ncbi:hypothetical protein O181_044839 [Austropuccinia psidii MF-1]|uniref:Uncharacterized protein n=1 Tax=Austropuccinia psidii MF-1 TaxID=1389203 RepID=A0A9Q3DL10_9BASI|nr:hypothetical protein [Austropuccinia psidii MF-1]